MSHGLDCYMYRNDLLISCSLGQTKVSNLSVFSRLGDTDSVLP